MLKIRKTCRVCGSSALTSVLSLGDQMLASNFQLSPDFPPVERPIPLELCRCNPSLDEDACGLVQLRHTVSPDLMYSAYGYRSGINQTMTEHLGGIAHALEDRVVLAAGDLVVDIGANDGTLLLQYRTKGVDYVGYEPSNIRPLEPTPTIQFIHTYFTASALKRAFRDRKAKIVTSIAMFYDLDDPNTFVADVAEILAPDGLWTLELSYLPSMLANNSFDTICHEHLEYYHLGTIEALLHRHDLVVADAELNGANGGSIRVTICHRGSRFSEHTVSVRARIYDLRKREFELALDTDVPYERFRTASEKIKADLPALLLRLVSQGKKVYGYGASTKGNVILQYCGLTPNHLIAIADRNPAKWGSTTVGSQIPIISEDEMRKASPDYLLVLPWHFMEEFQRREAEFLARGGRFIVPIPEARVLPNPR
jgi:hypothetical protein